MNPLLSSQNFFVLKTINPKKPDKPKLVVINEFDGFFNYMENQMAINAFGEKELSRKERAQLARDMLIGMIGKDEFLRLKETFRKSQMSKPQKKCSYKLLSESERIIFKLLAKGFSQAEIAELLDWSDNKVLDYKNQIYSKMNFAKKADLMEYASKNKMV